VLPELARLRAAPTDEALKTQLQERADVCSALRKRLGPLRAGAPRVSAADLAALDAEWTRWRAEWVRRRGVFRGYVLCSVLAIGTLFLAICHRLITERSDAIAASQHD
jgi:hypothetical protein